MTLGNFLNIETVSTLKTVIGNDFANAINHFIELLPQKIIAIETAIAKDNATELRFEAHALKGSARNVGADKLSELAYQLEILGKHGDINSASLSISTLTETAHNTVSELTHFVNHW